MGENFQGDHWAGGLAIVDAGVKAIYSKIRESPFPRCEKKLPHWLIE